MGLRKKGPPAAEAVALIRQGRQRFAALPLERACQLLGVARAHLYYRPADPAPALAEDARLVGAIERIVLEFPGYGYRRVTRQLQREGWAVNHKRVLRLMRRESLLCRLKRRWASTTDSAHGLHTYPNLLLGGRPTGLNQIWVADITYVRLPAGFCYLAAILDAFSRRVVGWELSLDIDARLVLAALEAALAARQPPAGFVHHSDRGVQYACRDYVERLLAAGARVSMSARGRPRDNAQAESFFRTLKVEEVYLSRYQDFAEALACIGRFIDDLYNAKRLHSSLGYLPPAEYEERLANPDALPVSV